MVEALSGVGEVRIHIQQMDQFGAWRTYTTQNNQRNAYRTAANRAAATGRRHRLISDDGTLLYLVNP